MRHEERFPPTKLSAGCGFRKETLAGMRRNGRDAPVADPGGPNAAGSSRPVPDLRRGAHRAVGAKASDTVSYRFFGCNIYRRRSIGAKELVSHKFKSRQSIDFLTEVIKLYFEAGQYTVHPSRTLSGGPKSVEREAIELAFVSDQSDVLNDRQRPSNALEHLPQCFRTGRWA